MNKYESSKSNSSPQKPLSPPAAQPQQATAHSPKPLSEAYQGNLNTKTNEKTKAAQQQADGSQSPNQQKQQKQLQQQPGLVKERYAINREEAQKQVRKFLADCNC